MEKILTKPNDRAPRMIKVRSKCPGCRKIDEWELPKEQLDRHLGGGLKLREAFPDLPEHRIQQLATHYCQVCQGPHNRAKEEPRNAA